MKRKARKKLGSNGLFFVKKMATVVCLTNIICTENRENSKLPMKTNQTKEETLDSDAEEESPSQEIIKSTITFLTKEIVFPVTEVIK